MIYRAMIALLFAVFTGASGTVSIGASTVTKYSLIAPFSGPVLYSFDFKDGKGILELENDQNTTYAYSEVASPVGGEKSARFEVRANGPNDGSSQRSELKIYRKTWHAEMHQEYWYGFKILLPNTGTEAWQIGGDRWCILAQWHDIPDGIDTEQLEEWRSPVLALAAINDKWKILYRFDPDKISDTSSWSAWDKRTLGNPQDPYAWQGQIDIPDPTHWYECPLDIGKWVKWVFRVKWEYDNTGILEVWKDDVKIISRLANPIGFNDDAGPTCKFGIYRNKPGEISGVQSKDRITYVNKYIVGDSNCTYKTISDFIEGTASAPENLLGAWPGLGVWLRDSASGNWQQLSNLNPIQLATGDVDGDLEDDLVGWWDCGLWIRYHTGTWQKIDLNLADLLWLSMGDMNGDGLQDIVVSAKSSSQGIWWRNSQDGQWQCIYNAMEVPRITVGDFDNDQIDDIAAVLNPSDIWLRYSSNGSWQHLLNSTELKFITTTDLNGDGWDEILGSWSYGVWNYDFAGQTWKRIFDAADIITSGDLNDLGKKDLIGVWPNVPGVWVRYTETGAWEKLHSASPTWITAGKVRAA